MAMTIIFQYFILFGAPDDTWTYPWSAWSMDLQRWYCVGAFDTTDLTFNFCAFFALSLHLRFVRSQDDDNDDEDAPYHSFEDQAEKKNLKTKNPTERDAIIEAASSSVDFMGIGCLRICDKIILLCIFIAGSLNEDVCSLGYMGMCLFLFFDRSTNAKKTLRKWNNLRRYNWFISFLAMVYQCPYIVFVKSYAKYRTLNWAAMIGLNKFWISDPDPEFVGWNSDVGGLSMLVIFCLVEFFVKLLSLSAYKTVVRKTQEGRSVARKRGLQSAKRLLERSKAGTAKAIRERDRLNYAFTKIWKEVDGLGFEFDDTAVWPTPPLECDTLKSTRDSAVFQEDDDGEKEEEKVRLSVTSEKDVSNSLDSKDASASSFKDDLSELLLPSTIRLGDELKGTMGTLSSRGVKFLPDERILYIYNNSLLPAISEDTKNCVLLTTDRFIQIDGDKFIPVSRKDIVELNFESAYFYPDKIKATCPDDDETSISIRGRNEAIFFYHLLYLDLHGVFPKQQTDGCLTRFWLYIRRFLIDYTDPSLVVKEHGQNETYALTLIYWFLSSHTEGICMCMYIANSVWNPNLLALVIPFLLMSFAASEYPRVSREFWLFCLFYTNTVVFFKFIYQLDFMCQNIDKHQYSLQPNPHCHSEWMISPTYKTETTYLIGIYKKNVDGTFAGMVVWDLVCIGALAWHRWSLGVRGLWLFSELEMRILSFFKRRQAKDKSQELKKQKGEELKPQELKEQLGEEPQELEDAEKLTTSPLQNVGKDKQEPDEKGQKHDEMEQKHDEKEEKKHDEKEETDEDSIFASGDKEKDSATKSDASVSTLDKIVELVGFRCINRFFLRLEPPFPVTDEFDNSNSDFNFIRGLMQKPGLDNYMLIFGSELLSCVLILFFFDELSKDITNSNARAFEQNQFSAGMVMAICVQLFIIILDRVIYLYRSSRAKIFLQLATLVYWNYYIFFVWPINAHRGFVDNPLLQFFYLVKCLYFGASVYQLKQGYLPSVFAPQEALTITPNWVWGMFFSWYRAIPFVFELRTLLDWMTSSTALNVYETFKLEDIHATVFLAQCNLDWLNYRQRGTEQPRCHKITSGCLLFSLLMFVIVVPLIIFSPVNPATLPNNVLSATFSLYLTGPAGQLQLVDISIVADVAEVDEELYQDMKIKSLITDDPIKTVQSISLSPNGNSYWNPNPPTLEAINRNLDSRSCILEATYTFTRPQPPERPTTAGNSKISLNKNITDKLRSVLNTNDTSEIIVPNAIPLYLRLLPEATARPIQLSSENSNLKLSIDRSDGTSWWKVTSFSNFHNPSDIIGPDFITVSNPALGSVFTSTGISYSILAFYVTVVLTVGRFVRLMFANGVVRVMFDDGQNNKTLLMFCDGIYLARFKHNLYKEEELYRRLLYIYRNPTLLDNLTRRKDPEKGSLAATDSELRLRRSVRSSRASTLM